MDLSGIISISGRPGLFKIVAQSKNTVIVESLIDKKRFPAYSTDRISALQDISIYTYEEDIPLFDVYKNMAKALDCKACISHKESANKLANKLKEYLPDYDSDRVYSSDIKKLFQWYNALQKTGFITLEEEKEEEETVKTEKTEKKTEKKPAETKTPTKKPANKAKKEEK